MIGQHTLGVWKVEGLQKHGFRKEAVADIQARDGGGQAVWA